jgi:hypothetical protein
MINIRAQAVITGPLFSGATEQHLRRAIDEAEQEIATLGGEHLRGDLGAPPFKNPTGWYKSHIVQDRIGPFWVITDSGVVYGEWLAGTSSRNRTSRFKGYQHWRRAIAYTHKISKQVAKRIIARALARG